MSFSDFGPWSLNGETQRILADPRLVVPFVGAGIGVGAGLPTGPGLAAKLRGHPLSAGATFSRLDDLVDVGNVLAAQAPDGRAQVAQFIVDLLDIDKHGIVPTEVVRNLVRTPSKCYLTTTYDLLAERAAADAGIAVESFTWKDLPPLNDVQRFGDHELYVVHLHGSIDDPDSLILDSHQYRDIGISQDVANFLVVLFSAFNVCFMGTSLDEPYLQAHMQSWRGIQPRHVLVGDEQSIKAATEGRNPIRAEAHGIETDFFPRGQWNLLTAFTRNLVDRPASSAAPLLASLPTGAPLGNPSAVLATPTAATTGVEVRYVRSDWGPAWTRRALEDLARSSEQEALGLQETLSSSAGPGVVRDLIENPPDWLTNGSFRLWTAVARFAEQQGDWKLARQAWESTAKCDGADAPAYLVSAAVAADLGGENAERERLMSEARALDPQHPRVRLQEVRLDTTPEDQLEQLRPLWDEPGDVGVMAHAHAALACLMQENLDEAARHLEEAKLERPDFIQIRVVEQNLVVQRYRIALAAGERIDARALSRAKDQSLAIRDELIAMRRWGESMRMLMLAADATALQWELEEAGRLLLTATEEERAARHGRTVLAEAALRAQQYEAALELAKGATADEVEILRASAELHIGDAKEKERAIATLNRLVATPGENQVRAATVLILAAPRLATDKDLGDVSWPEAAERVLRDSGFEEPALMSNVMWRHAKGDSDGALSLLRPHLQDIRAAELALMLAVQDGNNGAASDAANRVLALGPDNFTRVRCAEALLDIGDATRAKAEAAGVANDDTASAFERGYALYLLTKIATEVEHDFERALGFAERWAVADPTNERPVWARILALTQLARHEEALSLLEETHVAPRTIGDGRLAVALYGRLPDPIEALRRVKDVIDRARDPDPELNRQLQLLTILRGQDLELPEDIVAAVQPIDTNALGMQAVSIEALRQLSLQRQAEQEAVLKDIADGRTPTMTFAAMLNSDLGSVWARFQARPYSFGIPVLEFREAAAAEAALSQGFIADPTALFTAALLDGDAADAVRRALEERGHITQAGMHDIDVGVSTLLPESGTMTRRELLFDARTGQPIPIEWPKEQVEADHARAHRMLELAQKMVTERDPIPADGSQLDLLFDISAPTALRVMISTAAVARRTGRAALCDDRKYRLLLQELGVPAFGTTGLLSALHRRGDASRELTWDARAQLRANGYLGVLAEIEELTGLLDGGGGHASDTVRRVFVDPTPWNGAYGGQLRLAVDFILHISANYPDELVDWVETIVAAAADAVSLMRFPVVPLPVTRRDRIEWHSEWLLVAAWIAAPWGQPATRDFYARLGPALRRAADKLGFYVEPFPGAVNRYMRLNAQNGGGGGMPTVLVAQLPISDLMALTRVYVPWETAAERFENHLAAVLQSIPVSPSRPEALAGEQKKHGDRRKSRKRRKR